MKIGSAIRDIRKQKKISQKDLADASDVSQTTLSQVESGVKNPSATTLKKICDALQTSPHLVNLMALEATDIPEERRIMFDTLYPMLKGIVLQLAGPQNIE